MTESRSYILWGSAGHAKVLADIITLRGGKVVALFDNNPEASAVLPHVPLFIGQKGFQEWRQKNLDIKTYGLVAIGGSYGADRCLIQQELQHHGIIFEPILHPAAIVCDNSVISAGSQILAGAIIAANARIGLSCIINHGAIIDHESVLGPGVHIAPGATLCGCVTVGSNSMIGAGATILPRITIGTNSIIGAGAVVTRDVPDNVIVVGNPAQFMRQNPSR